MKDKLFDGDSMFSIFPISSLQTGDGKMNQHYKLCFLLDKTLLVADQGDFVFPKTNSYLFTS
jgi:hypothetical protein